ncbi:ACP S-malonyltransferase [Gorillibacterium timonense]|uniref:ACP S-malonyltransferase n=1 Tax=Gorillibacterium timonense TaxID=1689269 RepID=UPI00071C1F36|nr:ACP S-malonyltransferase [Gorillibacterium timonense]
MKRAYLFPGQGSQYVGMGKKLYDESHAAKETFEEACDVLGFDLKQMCFYGDLKTLSQTENTQPAILTSSVAAFRSFQDRFGGEPSYMAGHSLGEYSALVCSGTLSFAHALSIVRTRGMLMQEAVKSSEGGMTAISGVLSNEIEDVCIEVSKPDCYVSVSNYNSNDQTVISGHLLAVRAAEARLKTRGASVIPLKVSAPFHSELMIPAAEQLQAYMSDLPFHPLQYPVLSNVSALPYPSEAEIMTSLVKQMVKPVNWVQSMRFLIDQGVDAFIELGPGTVLSDLVKKIDSTSVSYSYDNEEDLYRWKERIGWSSPPSPQKLKLLTRCLAVAVCTPNQNWNNDDYRKGVVEPYQRIDKLVEEIEATHREPTVEEMRAGIDMLKSVFETKFTPLQEQQERFHQVLSETGTMEFFPEIARDSRIAILS